MSISIIVYTNENNFPIVKLYLDEFLTHNKTIPVSIYVISNKDLHKSTEYDTIQFKSYNIELCPRGTHFSATMKKALDDIDSEYILFFCDDYILTKPIDFRGVEDLCDIMKQESIDMFSFGAVPRHIVALWDPLNIDYARYGFEKDCLLHANHSDWMHTFSVQPCIWNKNSLCRVFDENKYISLHELDCSIIVDKQSYKNICYKHEIYNGINPLHYFIIEYIEVIRHGVFLLSLNGQHIHEDAHCQTILRRLFVKYDILQNPLYDKYFLFDKSLMYN